MPATRIGAALLVALLAGGCASDPDDSIRPTTSPSTESTASTAVPSTAVPTTIEPTVSASAPTSTTTPRSTATTVTGSTGSTVAPATVATVPPGILAAVPFQNRLDVAQNIFQVKLYNGTPDDYDIVGVRLVWEGLTTPQSDRANPLAAGDRLDYPVPLAPANCVGDGTIDSMPDPADGLVEVTLRDGTVLDAPVFDLFRFAQKLYLSDCERQHIDAEVRLEWADLHEVALDGRPVTEGVLRITRLESTTTVTVHSVSNTINFGFVPLADAGQAIGPDDDDPIAVLDAGDAGTEVPVRFAEGRCDAHARSESSQPFAFVLILDLGDGVERGYVLTPPVDDQVPMRERLDDACDILGTSGFAGQGDAATTTTG